MLTWRCLAIAVASGDRLLGGNRKDDCVDFLLACPSLLISLQRVYESLDPKEMVLGEGDYGPGTDIYDLCIIHYAVSGVYTELGPLFSFSMIVVYTGRVFIQDLTAPVFSGCGFETTCSLG